MKLFLTFGLLLACGATLSSAQWNTVTGYATLNGGTTGKYAKIPHRHKIIAKKTPNLHNFLL